jgi:hypothetical protein
VAQHLCIQVWFGGWQENLSWHSSGEPTQSVDGCVDPVILTKVSVPPQGDVKIGKEEAEEKNPTYFFDDLEETFTSKPP